MKYIKISNKGLIDINAFKLIGASTKREDSSKIGYFGSGLKYSMAYMLRNNLNFSVYSGDKEIKIGTSNTNYRDVDFQVITINDEPTSMTTAMGPSWLLWFVIREIYCNAIDEGSASIDMVDEIELNTDETSFYLEINSDIMEIVENWDYYFSMKRTNPIYDSNDIKLFNSNPNGILIYRKGVQCHFDSYTQGIFDYDFPNLTINESRVLDSMYNSKRIIMKWFATYAPENIISTLLHDFDIKDRNSTRFEFDMPWDELTQVNKDVWTAAIKDRTLVIAEIAGHYAQQIESSRNEYLILPKYLVEALERLVPDVKVLGESFNGYRFVLVDTNQKQEFLLKEAMKFFDEAQYQVKHDIKIAHFDDKLVLGMAKDDTILISEKVFNQGKRKLVEVIYEENEHILSGFGDETRSFQDHLISNVISQMEERCAYFL